MTASIRPARPTDQSFIISSWASSIIGLPKRDWSARPTTRQLAFETNQMVDALLDDARTKVLVACEPTNEDSIIGWVAFARIPGARVLEFVMVRRQRRREGIATALLGASEMLGAGARLVYLWNTADAKYLPPGTLMEPGDFL